MLLNVVVFPLTLEIMSFVIMNHPVCREIWSNRKLRSFLVNRVKEEITVANPNPRTKDKTNSIQANLKNEVNIL